MRRFFMQLLVVALGLGLTSAVHAGGRGNSGGGNKSLAVTKNIGPTSNVKTLTSGGSTSCKCYSKSNFCWSSCCWSSCYGCNCYWYPYDCCWYVWYQPRCCYVPYTYYITLVTPVATCATPAFGGSAVGGPAVASASTPGPLPGPTGPGPK